MEELNMLIKKANRLIDKCKQSDDKELSRTIKKLGYTFSRIQKVLVQDRCIHKPKEVYTCKCSYIICSKCDKLLSDVIIKEI